MITALIVGATLGGASRADAALSSDPDAGVGWSDEPIATVATNGPVTLAAGGWVNYIGRSYMGPLAVDATTGELDATTRLGETSNTDRPENLSVSDGENGWFVVRSGTLLHLDRDLHATLSVALHPMSDGTESSTAVTGIALSPDGTRVYLAGNFDTLRGSSRRQLAALSAHTGAVLDWSPQPNAILPGDVKVSPDGHRVYLAGGIVDPVDHESYDDVEALDATTGDTLAIGPPGFGSRLIVTNGRVVVAGACSSCAVRGPSVVGLSPDSLSVVWQRAGSDLGLPSATPDGSRAFVGTLWDGIEHASAVQISLSNGAPTGWSPAVPVQRALASADGSAVYAETDGDPGLVKLSADGRTQLPWTPTQHSGSLMAVGGDRVLLEAGRSFDATFRGGGALYAADGITTTALPHDATTSGQPFDYLSYPTSSAVGTDGTAYLAKTNQSDTAGLLQALRPDGTRTWKRLLAIDCMAISPDGRTLYVAGPFTSVDGSPRSGLAALSTVDGSLLDWAPTVAAGSVRALAIAPDGSRVYVGGRFSTVDGEARGGLAAVDAADGSLATRFHADVSGEAVRALAVSPAGDRVYVGLQTDAPGASTINGVVRDGVAAVRAVDGSVEPWNPGVVGENGDSSVVASLAVDPAGRTVYLALPYSETRESVDGVPRDNLAAVSATTGRVTPWNPATVSNSERLRLALSPDGSQLWVGGDIAFLGTGARDIARFTIHPDVGATVPSSVVAPTISADGAALACSTGRWSGAPSRFRYSWTVDDAPVLGATGDSLTAAADAADQSVRCRVTAVNDVGSASATSAAVVVTATTSSREPQPTANPPGRPSDPPAASPDPPAGEGTWPAAPADPPAGEGTSPAAPADPPAGERTPPAAPGAASPTTAAPAHPSSSELSVAGAHGAGQSPFAPQTPSVRSRTALPVVRALGGGRVVAYGHPSGGRRTAGRRSVAHLRASEAGTLAVQILRCAPRGACIRPQSVHTIRRTVMAGAVSLTLEQVSRGRRLRPAGYRLVVVLCSGDGRRSEPVVTAMRVVSEAVDRGR